MTRLPKHILIWIALLLVVSLTTGCGVYFNTFYNAKQAFNDAESERKSSKGPQPRIKTASYNTAIEKALKVVENHPNSKYYDDAVYVLGVSYYWTGQYSKSERRFREILTNYAKSKYARDARLYLAQSLLQQEDVSDAMEIFEELFNSKIDKEQKAKAAIALGDFHFNNGDYETAGRYYLAVRDSLGNNQEKLAAQTQIADGLFKRWRWADALAAYLQVLGLDPGKDDKYHALYQSAICSYRLMRIDEGLDYLRTLADDEIYFDSLPRLQLTMAEGYEWRDDLGQAEDIYRKVAEESTNKQAQGEAYYDLGLMYQYDYDQLTEAKEFYDKAVEVARGSEFGQEALTLSSNIGKLETFKQTQELDSTATQDMIDEAAFTQYQLAELYWFQLNKPDTAMLEMQYVVDSFPNSYDAPKAAIALAQMILTQTGDTARADSILQLVLTRYPHSDYVPQAIVKLGLENTPADTGYAEKYLRRAEDYLVTDSGDPGPAAVDSARSLYQKVVDDYPESKYYLQSRFALIWLTEQYQSPGDSSVIFAYQAFADSFPGSPWAQEAQSRTQYRPQGRVGQPAYDTTQNELAADTVDNGEVIDSTTGEVTGIRDPAVQRYIDPEGGMAIDLPADVKPLEVREPFVYPTEAYAERFEGDLYFQIQLDFSGQVSDIVQKSFSGVAELDLRAKETILSSTFDTRLLRPEMIGKWFVYRFRVRLPDHLR